METKHTPESWVALQGGCPLDPDDDTRWTVCTAGEMHYCIATIENGQPGDTLETEKQRAHLFAAAPDLLAAMPTIGHPGGRLVKVVAHYESGATQTISGDIVEAAIAKAKGGGA